MESRFSRWHDYMFLHVLISWLCWAILFQACRLISYESCCLCHYCHWNELNMFKLRPIILRMLMTSLLYSYWKCEWDYGLMEDDLMIKLKETRENGFKRHNLTRFISLKFFVELQDDDLEVIMDLKKYQNYVFGAIIEKLKRKWKKMK